MMKKIALLIFLFTAYLIPAYSLNIKAAKQPEYSEELVQLTDWLAVLQTGLKETADLDQIWIGGGSARAILDHLYFNKPLEMRDLDIFVVANREVDEAFVEKIGYRLQSENFGHFSKKDLRSRPRVPNDKPVLTRNHYVAGFGLHWLRANGEILDLSVYHTKEDLDLNGIFDIDTIMIPLTFPFSLLDFAQKTTEMDYDALSAQGWVYDRFGGYEKWIDGNVNIVNWLDIEADPLLKSLRVVRTLFKNNKKALTQEESINFAHLLKTAKVENLLQMTRGLLKVLEDDEAVEELCLLQKIGLFDHWVTAFQDLNFKKIDLSRLTPLHYGRGDRLALARLYALIQQLPNLQTRLEAASMILSTYDSNTLATWMHQAFMQEEKIFSEDKTLSQNHLEKICMSTVLSVEEKKELFQKEITGTWKPRKGIITGVFNPVHLGHIETFQEALVEMVLDELIVVPIYADSHILLPWEERYKMLKLIENEVPGLSILPAEYAKEIQTEANSVIRAMIQENPDVSWVRVIGSDFQKTYYESGAYDQELCSQILVLQRGETPFYPIEEDLKKTYCKAHQPDNQSHQKRHQAKNARKLASEGKDLSDFVPARVADYILTHKLYQNKAPLYCLTTNEHKFKAVQTIFPDCAQIPVDLPLTHLSNPESAVKEKLQNAMETGKFPMFVIEQFIKIKALSSHFIPLSDFTLQSLGTENIARLIELNKSNQATLLTVIAYADSEDKIHIYQERLNGLIDPTALRKADYFDVNKHVQCTVKGIPLERVLKRLKKEKIGFMTGVFNPIHLGHLDAVERAQKELGLDKIILIPTLATNHNEQPIPWQQRMDMADLATQNSDYLEVIPCSYLPELEQGTGRVINRLMEEYPNATFWHIMGSDSYERFAQNVLQPFPDRYNVAVIERIGYPIKSISDNVTMISSSSSISNKERASSTIRHLLQYGQSIAHLVLPAVEAYIQQNRLYQSELAQAA